MSGAGYPNPEKLRPLTKHALEALDDIARRPRPEQDFNPGVRDRFDRGGLVERVNLQHPDAWRGIVPHLQITETGRAVLEAKR